MNLSNKKLLVTHHSPDLDAITSVWLLKRFDSVQFANATISFVNPGEVISLEQAEVHGMQPQQALHLDTGFGEFDHHQPERAKQNICASKLVLQYLIHKYPDLASDIALVELVEYVNQIDHFQEVGWPESGSLRFAFTISELIRGSEFTNPHDDYSQLYFGFQCLDNAYASCRQLVKAKELIKRKGQQFLVNGYKALAINSRNDDTIKLAQKMGFSLVVKKDPIQGNARIKVRPDSKLDLTKLWQEILKIDQKATWYFHGSGKMLLNGSNKHRGQLPTCLTLQELVNLIQKFVTN